MTLKVTRSSGNVFRDIGFSPDEAEPLLVRSDLLIKVQKLIETKRLKQAELVITLRIPRKRISELRRGRIDLFSTDALIDILARLGVRVRLVLKPSRRGLKAA
jgi:predicted XRE-type DNA-binding protein